MALKPSTTMGWWSIVLIVGLFVFFGVFQALLATGQRGGDTFLSNLALAIPIVLAGAAGIAAFVTGMIGIVARRERSPFVFLVTLIGLFVLIFAAGEFIYPH